MKVQHLPKEYLEELGHRIKVIRTFMQLEQKDLANHMKTGQSQISKIEAGKAAPSLYHLLMIKRLADEDENLRGKLSWSWLLEGKGAGIF